MPGGKPTVTHTSPELGSFLVRKRRSLALWCKANGINSEADLQKLINRNEWTLSEQTLSSIRSGFSIPAPVETVLVVEQPILVEEPKQELQVEEEKPVVVIPEQPAVELEEKQEEPLVVEAEKLPESVSSQEDVAVQQPSNYYTQSKKKGRY